MLSLFQQINFKKFIGVRREPVAISLIRALLIGIHSKNINEGTSRSVNELAKIGQIIPRQSFPIVHMRQVKPVLPSKGFLDENNYPKGELRALDIHTDMLLGAFVIFAVWVEVFVEGVLFTAQNALKSKGRNKHKQNFDWPDVNKLTYDSVLKMSVSNQETIVGQIESSKLGILDYLRPLLFYRLRTISAQSEFEDAVKKCGFNSEHAAFIRRWTSRTLSFVKN